MQLMAVITDGVSLSSLGASTVEIASFSAVDIIDAV